MAAFLATALFSEARTGYWRTCLEAAAEPERVVRPADSRRSLTIEAGFQLPDSVLPPGLAGWRTSHAHVAK